VAAAEIAGALLAVGLGASIGSFLAVVLERVPRGESLGGRSHCACGAPIPGRDNLPVVSYLVRRGRARCCGTRIPAWYLAIEVAGALVALGLYLGVALT
jgi:prepilin signal peptidase PulO-like enzyme (type II secretory pathway)